MIGSSSSSRKVTLGGLVIAMALMACGPTSAKAGLATIPTGTQIETKIDWTHQVSLNVESSTTSTTSTDTQSLFASEPSATTQSTASIATIETARNAAEAPMPPAVISGSVMLLIGAAAARSMKRKLAM
jgi:hypothetical protein